MGHSPCCMRNRHRKLEPEEKHRIKESPSGPGRRSTKLSASEVERKAANNNNNNHKEIITKSTKANVDVKSVVDPSLEKGSEQQGNRDEHDDDTLLSQFEVNVDSEPGWIQAKDKGEEEQKSDEPEEDEKETSFKLLLGRLQKSDEMKDELSEEDEEKIIIDEEDELVDKDGDEYNYDGTSASVTAPEGDAGMSVLALTRAAQVEEEIKTYIRNNGTNLVIKKHSYFLLTVCILLLTASNLSARELRIKYKMGHPRAKRLMQEVMYEMQKETRNAKKRKTADPVHDDDKDTKEKERKEQEKEPDQNNNKKSNKTPDQSKAAEKIVTSAEKDTLMKDLHILLLDLPEPRHQDAVDAIKEMGGTSYRASSEAGCLIEGVTWKIGALPPFTHLLCQHQQPTCGALVPESHLCCGPCVRLKSLLVAQQTKLELHGVTDLQLVSLEWLQWCDVHKRLFSPQTSPLFQPLPSTPIPEMNGLVTPIPVDLLFGPLTA